jgi:hypothetical protein
MAVLRSRVIANRPALPRWRPLSIRATTSPVPRAYSYCVTPLIRWLQQANTNQHQMNPAGSPDAVVDGVNTISFTGDRNALLEDLAKSPTQPVGVSSVY